MAYLCGNCGTPLVFDPGTQRVRCSTCNGKWFPEEVRTSKCEKCGSSLDYDPLKQIAVCRKCGASFFPEQIKNKDREYLETIHAEPAEAPTEGALAEFIDCFVYACHSCGAKVNINGTEISTMCVYCGSPTVVFERISREKAPEFILPFQVNQELAEQMVREQLNKGKFVSKNVKNIQFDQVRGIYIPYWICDGIHAQSMVHYEVHVHSRGNMLNGYHADVSRVCLGNSGIMEFSNLLQDASVNMPDESTLRLEPFDMRKLKYFNEGYLLGFYSNSSDIYKQDLQKAVNKRMEVLFEQEIIGFRDYKENTCKSKASNTLINEDVRYALLPVWFFSFNYNGKHHTMLVNGESGKVVGGIPWNGKLFAALVAVAGVLFSALFAAIIYYILGLSDFAEVARDTETQGVYLTRWIVILTALAGVLISYGIIRIKKTIKQIRLSQSTKMFQFVRRRQGGED